MSASYRDIAMAAMFDMRSAAAWILDEDGSPEVAASILRKQEARLMKEFFELEDPQSEMGSE